MLEIFSNVNGARVLNFLHFRLLNLSKKEKERMKECREDVSFTTSMDALLSGNVICHWLSGLQSKHSNNTVSVTQLLLDVIIGLSILI